MREMSVSEQRCLAVLSVIRDGETVTTVASRLGVSRQTMHAGLNVGGFVLADGTKAKALTGVDDHSRFCVCARLMLRESSRQVCDGLSEAMRRYGVPQEILTDNGKVFTGRFNQPPAEVFFDRICSENGITPG